MTNEKIGGEQNPSNPPKQKGELSKEEVMFKVDIDGTVMAEVVDVEVYDRALDDEIYMTTMELDNALSMHESTDKSFKQLLSSNNKEIEKVKNKINELQKLEKLSEEQIKQLAEHKLALNEREKVLRSMELQNAAKIQAFKDKSIECRKDLDYLEKTREENKEIRTIKAVPCTVLDSHRYFAKHMWKNEKGEWQEPADVEDITYVDYLLAEKVSSPKLTVKEWENTLPFMKFSVREAIAEISFYKRPSPKEILVERRRSDKLKNILGESQN